MENPPIKVLIVDDSSVIRELLENVLSSDPRIKVIGTARDGTEALEAIAKGRPDVITMDINMPKMNGFEVTRIIMETQPVPIVIVSATWRPEEIATTFRAIEAGAVAIVEKPRGIGHPDFASSTGKLIETVKRMAEIKVIRRWPRLRKADAAPAALSAAPVAPGSAPAAPSAARNDVRIVAIGSSTGGPLVLQTILGGLSSTFPAPILIVQHIAPGFTAGLVDWLGPTTGFPVHLAKHGEVPLPAHAYVAPDGMHMGMDSSGRIALSNDEPEGGLRPSVAYLFRSMAAVFGSRAVGVLLTGMGKDGAIEMKRMKDRGAATIAQDKATSVVHGMPGEAIRLGAVDFILPSDRIAPALLSLVKLAGVSA